MQPRIEIYHADVFEGLSLAIDTILKRPFKGDVLAFGSTVLWSYGGRAPSDLDLVVNPETWNDFLESGIFELAPSPSGEGDSLRTEVDQVQIEVFTCWPYISYKSLWTNASRFAIRGLLGSLYNLCLYKYGAVELRANKDEPLGSDLKHLVDLIYILETHPELFTVLPPNAISVIISQAKLNGVTVNWAGV